MKKLDEIPKKNIFEVPEGYFDRLPLKIQARVETTDTTKPASLWSLGLKYALPVIILGTALFFFLKPNLDQTEDLLASVPNEHLMAYLNETDITVNDLLEIVNFNETDADSLTHHLNNILLGDFNVNEMKGELENEL